MGHFLHLLGAATALLAASALRSATRAVVDDANLNGASSSGAQTKLPLGTANAINAFGQSFYNTNSSALLDEQQLAGDPAGGAGGEPKSPWETPWDETYYAPGPQLPVMVIDLNCSQPALVTSVWAYRGYGKFNVSGVAGTDAFNPSTPQAAWLWAFGGAIPSGQGWHAQNFSAPVPASYLTFTVSGATGGSFLEVVVYGTCPGGPPPPPGPNPAPLPLPPLSRLLGTNGFALAGMENVTGVVGSFREYQDADWTETALNDNTFQPSDDNHFFLDDFYGNLSQPGVLGAGSVHQCLQKSPGFVHNGVNADEAWKPISVALLATPGASVTPGSYTVTSSHGFQVAARYGRTPVAASMLLLKQGQPVKTALGSLGWLEFANEPDGTWNNGRYGFWAPYELAAFYSAVVDGHEGTMGPGYGVKAADTSMKVTTSGLAGVDIDYFEAMRLWFAAHRTGRDFPADALQVHTYCRNAQDTSGVSPEAAALEATMAGLCSYRDAKLPGKEVWLGEFGWDTVGGPSVAPPIGSMSQQEVQGAWLLRGVLALARAGLDATNAASSVNGACVSRATMYMLSDVESTSGGVFATSGLTASGDFGYAPKVSWYYYAAFTGWLGEATQHSVANVTSLPGTPPGSIITAQCLRLSNASMPGGGFALALWSPTSSDVRMAGVSVPLTAAAGAVAGCAVAVAGDATVQLVVPAAGHVRGNVTTMPLASDGSAVVTVTETPIIILPHAAVPTGTLPTAPAGGVFKLNGPTVYSN